MLRQWGLAVLLAVAVPAGGTACGCSGDCDSIVSFEFKSVMDSLPSGSSAKACVGNQCDTPAPGQHTAKVFLDDPGSEVTARLTVTTRGGEELYARTQQVK